MVSLVSLSPTISSSKQCACGCRCVTEHVCHRETSYNVPCDFSILTTFTQLGSARWTSRSMCTEDLYRPLSVLSDGRVNVRANMDALYCHALIHTNIYWLMDLLMDCHWGKFQHRRRSNPHIEKLRKEEKRSTPPAIIIRLPYFTSHLKPSVFLLSAQIHI